MSFSTEVELALTVPSSELRSARAQIEGAIGDMSVGVSSEGPAARATGGGGGGAGGRRGRRLFRWARQRTSLMEDTVGLLEGIEDKIGEGGGGGGLIGGALGGVGLRSLLGGGIAGAVTGTVSVAASKVISITASTWGAGKLLTITAGTWAAEKLISIGSALTLGAKSLITVGSVMTVGAVGLIAVGSVLTLDALELIDIGAAIEADWDDVVTLEGSVPFEAGQDFAEENPGAAEGIHTAFTQNPIHDLGAGITMGERLAEDAETLAQNPDARRQAQAVATAGGAIRDAVGGDAESARGAARQRQVEQSTNVNIDNRTEVTVDSRQTVEELRREFEGQLEGLRQQIERATGGTDPNP